MVFSVARFIVVPHDLWELCSNTPRGCLKLWIVPNCICMRFFLYIHTLHGFIHFWNCQHHYSCTWGPSLSKTRITWTWVLQHHDSQSDDWGSYCVSNLSVVCTTWRCWTKDDSPGCALGGTEWDYMRFHHTTWNGVWFQTYELFVFRILYLICLHHGWLQVTETPESKQWIRDTTVFLYKKLGIRFLEDISRFLTLVHLFKC